MTHRPSVAATPATPAPATGPATPTHGLSPSLLTSLQKRAAHLRSLLNSLPDVADAASPSPRPAPLVAPLAGQQQRAVGLHGANSAATAGAIGQHERGVVAEAGAPGQALTTRSRESSSGSAGGRIRPSDVRVSASQLAAAAASASAAFAAVREDGSLNSSPAKDTAASGAASDAGPDASMSTTGGAAASVAGVAEGGASRGLADSRDGEGLGQADRRAKLAGGPSVGRLPASACAPFIPEPTADGPESQHLQQTASMPGVEFSTEGQTFSAPRVLPQEQQLLPARFMPHPPAQPPAPLPQPGQPLHSDRQSGHAGAPSQRSASPAASAPPHHPAIPAPTRTEDAEPPSTAAVGAAGPVLLAGSSPSHAGRPDSHRGPSLALPVVRVPAHTGAALQDDASQGQAAAVQGPQNHERRHHSVPPSAETLAFTSGSHFAAASAAAGAGVVAEDGQRPQPQGMSQSSDRAAGAAGTAVQTASGVSADALGGGGKLADDYLQQPDARTSAAACGVDAPHAHLSEGVGSSDDGYQVRAQGREAALSEDVLAAAIAAARISAQAAFFSPGAQRAVPRQAGYSGRASSSGTPASPGGGGGGAYHRQPHVMGTGGISAAAAPYISHSPGAITPGTGTAASSVRSGFSPVRSPYDLLLHGGLTTGPAAVLLPVGPGSDAGRGAGSIVVPGGAARAAWSTASTAGGSSVGVGSSGGGTSRARAGGARGTEAMGTEFFRRNNLLQRKRQQWAAQGQRERESESGVSTEHRLSLTGAGTAAVNKPHALGTGAADMGTPQAPIRSLEDLQRWAMRRDKRLAVLREEREVAERQLQESHPFQPTITEKSRRMVEAARARSPASRSQRPWAASPLPGSAAGGSIDGVVETADAAPAAAEQPTAQTTSKHPPQQPQQQQQQQDAIPLPGVPAADAGDLLNALRGSRPWHTPPQAAAINAAAASLRSSVTAAAAVELLNAASTATAASPDRSEIHGKSQAGSRTAAPAKTPGKATATMTPGRAGGSGAAAAGGGTPSAAALLTAARHSRSRGRYSLAADTEAVVGAVAEAIEDAAAALRRTIEGSTSPRRSAGGLVTRLRASGAANDVSAGRSAEGAAPQAVAAARTKGRQAEPPAAPRHASGYQGATALAQQIGPQDSGSYAAAYGAHHQASAPAGLHGAPPILGTQQGVHAGTYYPASVDTAVRGVGSSGGGAGGSGGGATLPGVAPTPFTIVPDPRQPFPGYGAVGSSGVAATTFGAAAADGSSRPVSNSGWAAELMSGSRDSITVAASAGAASAAAAARQALAAGGGSRRSTRSTSGAGRSAAFAVAARRTSSSGGTGGGSAGGAEPGSASPVQRPQAPVAPHSPSPSSSPIPAFASPASAVRGSANNSSRMSRARVSWSDLVSGGEGGSGGGAAGAEPDPRRSAGGTSEGVGVAEGSALTTKPASGFMMGTVGAFRPSFDGASSRGMATTLPAPTVLTTAMEPPVATSFTVLPLVAGSHGELRTPHATLHGQQGEPHQRQQQEQQGSLGPRPGPQTQAVAAPTAAAPDIYSYPARGGSAMSAVAAALAVEASSTTDSPGTGSHHDPAATTAGGSVPTGAASFMPTALGAAAYQHVPAVALPAVQETSDGGASSRARSHDASAGGAVSEPSFAAMPWSAARSVAVGSSSGGGAKSATRGLSPSDGTSVFGAVTLTLNNDAGQAEPPATPPPLTPAPEEHNVEATRQRHQELEGRKDSLAVALEAALLVAAAAATAAAASAEKGRKLAAGGDAVTTDAAVERIETLAVAHTDRSPATQMAVCNDANGSGATLRVKGAVTESVAPPASASIAAGANNELGNALIDSEPSSPVHTRHVPLSSVHSTEGVNEAHVSAARAPVVKQPAAAASDVPAPPVSQMALATAAALAMRARSETSLQAIAAPGTFATGTSAALGLEGVPGELAVSGRAELHSGLILAMTAAGPVHVPLGGGTSVSAGGAVAATPSPSYASASAASAPRDARGVAFTRLPASNPSSAASTPRKMSASLSMSAAHSLAAAAAATAAAAGASSSAGGAPPALPHVSQQSALLRGYASAGGAPDMHPRPSSPLRPVGSVRKHGLALPPGVDGLALSSTCPASPPNGVMASAAMLVDVAAGITPPGASSSRRRSSLLSAGGPVERPLVQSCPVSVTSPQEPAQVDNSAGAEADALLAIRHARSPVAALVSAGLMPQREPEGQQHQERQQQWLTEQQVEPEATKAHDDGNEGDPLQTLLRRIEALRSGSAAVVANPSASSDARSEAGPAAGAAAALTAPGSAAAAAQKAHTGNQSADTPVRLADRISGVVSSPGAAELSLDALVQRAELARAAALMAAMEPEVKSPPPRSSDALQHGTAPAALTAARHTNGVSPSSNAPTPRHQAAEADTAVESPAPSEAQPSAYSMPRQGGLPSPGLCDMQGGVEAEATGVPEPMRSSWSLADYVPSTGATRSQR